MANWFVALPVSGSWLAPVLTAMPASCRGFAAADLHLTVAFFGAMGPRAVDRVIQHLGQLREASFLASFDRLVPLPHARRFSAIAFSLNRGRDRASNLIRTLRDPLLALAGVKPDRRDPKPHVTIARLKRKANVSERHQTLAWMETVEPPCLDIEFTQMALYTWSENRKETQFKIVARFDMEPFR